MIFKSTRGQKHCSGGESGSFFFKTHDDKFIIKTIKKSEIDLYLDILPKMLLYFESTKRSYIMRIYGLFTIKVKSFRPIHVMMQKNAFPLQAESDLLFAFDLKGSSFQRSIIPQ